MTKAHSTSSAPSGKPAKPSKPYADFPLTPHPVRILAAKFYREMLLGWEGNRWTTVSDREIAVIVNRFIRCIFEEDARWRDAEHDEGEEGKKTATICHSPFSWFLGAAQRHDDS